MKKLAVVFPGIGYHTDKPLLYYSKKIAACQGFEIREVPYGNFPPDVKGSAEKMEQAFRSALAQCGEILRDVDFGKYDEILFLSKSIGTAV
ncbi:MAG: alpha/beta hydrolase, partial [Lachnospiraceae bacterium]|nr:alpha/beta hydrolase [Lachnospiraceae bacterium]